MWNDGRGIYVYVPILTINKRKFKLFELTNQVQIYFNIPIYLRIHNIGRWLVGITAYYEINLMLKM